jgi:hypothetical protein
VQCPAPVIATGDQALPLPLTITEISTNQFFLLHEKNRHRPRLMVARMRPGRRAIFGFAIWQ